MALIVIPLELKQQHSISNSTQFSNTSISNLNPGKETNDNYEEDEIILNNSTSVLCQTQVFFNLFVICTRSWSIAAFIILHHIHDGIIPTAHSTFVLMWTWIVAALLVLPTIIVKDSFVDFQKCGLIPQNYGMIIYVSFVLFLLPATILAPSFIKFTKINKQFNIRRDISSDFLDHDDPKENDNDDEEDFDHETDFDLRPEVVQIFEDSKSGSSRSESLPSLEQAHR